jgi:tetratricopeptide (TPR) repeat protein
VLSGYRTVQEKITVNEHSPKQKYDYALAPVAVAPPERYALLVGANQPGRDLTDFVHAGTDVLELSWLLLASGFDRDKVVVLTQGRALKDPTLRPSAARIREDLRSLALHCNANDTLLVALAGHVVQLPGNPESYFCPAGARLEEKSTLLPLSDIYRELGECRAKLKLLILDGWRKDWQQVVPPPIQVKRMRPAKLTPPAGVLVLCGCSAGELGYEHGKAWNGVFYHYLLEGLHGYADDNRDEQVTLAELLKYLRKHVADHAGKQYQGKQTPELLGAAPADSLVLVRVEVKGTLGRHKSGLTFLKKAEEQKQTAARKSAAEAAVAAFTDGIKVDGKYPGNFLKRAAAYFHAGKYDLAITDCENILEREPSYVTGYSYLGEAQLGQGLTTAAVRNHDKAIELEPRSAMAHDTRGQSCYQLGQEYYRQKEREQARKQFDLAIRDHSEAIRLNPTLKWSFYNRSAAYLMKDEYDLSIADQNQALKLDKQFADAWFGRGVAYYFKKQYELAIADLTEAIKLNPEFVQAYVYRSRAHAALGHKREAEEDSKKAKELQKKLDGL